MLRFTIRDVLWLTVVVAVALGLGLGWWRDRRDLLSQINRPHIMDVHVDGNVERLKPGETLEVKNGADGTLSVGVIRPATPNLP